YPNARRNATGKRRGFIFTTACVRTWRCNEHVGTNARSLARNQSLPGPGSSDSGGSAHGLAGIVACRKAAARGSATAAPRGTSHVGEGTFSRRRALAAGQPDRAGPTSWAIHFDLVDRSRRDGERVAPRAQRRGGS